MIQQARMKSLSKLFIGDWLYLDSNSRYWWTRVNFSKFVFVNDGELNIRWIGQRLCLRHAWTERWNPKCIQKKFCVYIFFGMYNLSYLFGSIVVNLSCKNSHYYTIQGNNFNIVRFLEFKNAYSYTVGVEFSFFNAQTV